ncbi:MAG: signal peptidase I [Anaerolinea sp.]|nr:signal peptidase I [Anaerolinea sp.]
MLALLVFLSVRASFQNFKVDGNSMYPTLEDGQFLIVNKLVYSKVDMEKLSNFVPFVDPGSEKERNVFHGPQRGDIVVLVDPRKPDIDLIKRVIGLPGETVEILDGKVYVNDFLLEEPYIKKAWHDNKAKVLVPPGFYFVMGDNRDNSLDSRSQQVGFVPEDLIIGKAMLSYWPSNKFGLAPNQAGNVSQKDGVPRLTAQTIDQAR